MTELSIAEQILYSTVRIEAKKSNGVSTFGSGFFMRFAKDERQFLPTIVTNKHVIYQAQSIVIVSHLADGTRSSGQLITTEVALDGICIYHPDPEIDIVAIQIGSVFNHLITLGHRPYMIWLDKEVIPGDADWLHFDAIEDVTMIGYPNALYDQVNNMPIVRRGITASSLAKDYNGKPEFLVDMACYPGSSGSPVFLFDQSGYYDKRTHTHMMGKPRLQLVGILYAGPVINNTGQVVLEQAPTIQVTSTMHLGNVVKSNVLNAIDTLARNIA